MADHIPFSPTGYWAHYKDSDSTWNFPVVGHGVDALGVTRAQIYDGHEGALMFVDEVDDLELLGVFPFPAGE